ncbi:hypothetical protein PsYK624_057830 [Phanerochaete sordida]|uniref:Uncharacterized protein n=1 Tax=Phanerochaete sordida TaxID=48140 RepID=A0A9P3G5N2_9APHY|nr:hypothetical protein PsYK624_057830 [Phanerochaete sordida]
MHSEFVRRLAVWLVAALIAWGASLWASGELEGNLRGLRLRVLQYVSFEPVRPSRRVGLLGDIVPVAAEADVTAVVLNWSRFPNVLKIASTLCSPSLDGLIAEVFIWNNSPTPISYNDFVGTGCPQSKLRIHNSSANVYFQARFLGCAQATTQYCFIQDDDYLVVPEVVHALRARIHDVPRPHTIHLLPPHEHLTSTLREIRVAGLAPIHTSFAWLGHGAMLHRSEAADFMDLMRSLNASDAELKMADNYYTILSNRPPEIWFDQGVELGGGQPFTVGEAGEDRNNRHILRATEYLTALRRDSGAQYLPYVSRDPEPAETSVARAACRGARCLLETNIALLPGDLEHICTAPSDMLEMAKRNRARLNDDAAQLYLHHPPSHAVDDRAETFFQSFNHAAAGDYLIIDTLRPGEFSSLRMVALVDSGHQAILKASELETSVDGLTWYPRAQSVACTTRQRTKLQRCSFDFFPIPPSDTQVSAPRANDRWRFVRLRLREDQYIPWKIYEIFLEFV